MVRCAGADYDDLERILKDANIAYSPIDDVQLLRDSLSAQEQAYFDAEIAGMLNSERKSWAPSVAPPKRAHSHAARTRENANTNVNKSALLCGGWLALVAGVLFAISRKK